MMKNFIHDEYPIISNMLVTFQKTKLKLMFGMRIVFLLVDN